MRSLVAAVTSVAVALWFGGLVTLTLCVVAVFSWSGLEREVAGKAAASMFVAFGRVQLVFAAVALIGTFAGYVLGRRPGAVILFAMLAVGAVGAVAFNAVVIPRIEEMRLAGLGGTPDFQALHKNSERLMGGITVALLAATAMLPAFARGMGGGGKAEG